MSVLTNSHRNEYLIDALLLAVEEYRTSEIDQKIRVLHQQLRLIVLGEFSEALQVVCDACDPLHCESETGNSFNNLNRKQYDAGIV